MAIASSAVSTGAGTASSSGSIGAAIASTAGSTAAATGSTSASTGARTTPPRPATSGGRSGSIAAATASTSASTGAAIGSIIGSIAGATGSTGAGTVAARASSVAGIGAAEADPKAHARPGEGPLQANHALDRFLAGVEARAFRIARIATGSREEALDVVQDAMWKLASRYGDHDPAEWPPLFHTILQRRIRDSLRRSRVRNRFRAWLGGDHRDHEGDPIEELPDRRGADPAERVAQGRATEVLEAALRALPPRQQQAFLLRAWEGLDVRETARAMGCSQGSVKTHYARALGALRARLEGHWP